MQPSTMLSGWLRKKEELGLVIHSPICTLRYSYLRNWLNYKPRVELLEVDRPSHFRFRTNSLIRVFDQRFELGPAAPRRRSSKPAIVGRSKPRRALLHAAELLGARRSEARSCSVASGSTTKVSGSSTTP